MTCSRSPRPAGPAALSLLIAASLAACAVGPAYQRPSAEVPVAWRESPADGWQPAAPADAVDRGAWWRLFGDPELDRLAEQVAISNQNIAAAVAAYAQALAAVREQRAALFPALSLSGGATRSGGGRGGNSAGVGAGSSSGNNFQAALGASWEPDLWGRLGLAAANASANAQASEADLAAARLSAQALLATNYFSLREADAEIVLVRDTVEAYARAQQIVQNRYDAGIVARTDLLQAQTQLANARADLAALHGQRAQFEHAIAVLVGRAPGDFRLAEASWVRSVPDVPPGLPSTLLERRPDIASAERAVAAANAQIGIQRSAYYPSLTLSGSYGTSASRIGDLASAGTTLWSLGLSVAQTLFDAGATRARVEGAEAARDIAVANYRQTVLAAFQGVEDQLSAARSLAEQEQRRREASAAADLTEQQLLNRYQAGQVSFTDVVTAQASALNARRSVAQLAASRQNAAVGLIQALGGGWQASSTAP